MKSFTLCKKKTIAKTLILSYVAVILICMIVVGFVTYRYERILREENENLSYYLFKGVSQSVREILYDIRGLNRQIVDDPSIQSIADHQSEDGYWNSQTALDGIANLKNYTTTRENLDLVFIYLKLSDEVLSSHGILSSDMFYTLYFEDCGISYEDWVATLRGNEKERYINLNFNLEKKCIPAVALLSPLSKDRNAIMSIMVDKNKLLRDFNQYDFRNYFDVYIYNTYNRLIIYEKNTPGEEIPNTLSDLLEQRDKNKDVLYCISENGATGEWTVATAVPKRIFSLKIWFMRFFVSVLSVIAAIILVFLIKFSIKRNTAYIKRMTDILNLESQENEYQSLYSSVEQVLCENRMLQREQTQKMKALRHMVLARIIKGYVLPAEEFDKYDLQLYNQFFAVLTFYLEDIQTLFSDTPQLSNGERKESLQFIIQNVFEEKFCGQNMKGYVTEVDGLSVCLINLHRNDEQTLLQIKRIADEGISFINENFGLELTFALSGICEGQNGIADGYIKTLEALEQKKRLGIQESILYNEISFDYSDGYLFDLDKESKLIHAIRSGNAEEAQEIVNQVFRLLESKRNFSTEYIRYIIQDILSAITKTIAEASVGGMNMESELSLCQKLLNEPLEVVHQQINDRLAGICSEIAEHASSKNTKIQKRVQNVIDYVQSNYYNPSLNVASIGDHFDMSPYYISKLFKEETGVTLIDYLNRYRIQKAKALMESSNLSGKDIAEKVGFNHVRTFYRLLKKHIEE